MVVGQQEYEQVGGMDLGVSDGDHPGDERRGWQEVPAIVSELYLLGSSARTKHDRSLIGPIESGLYVVS